MNNIVHIKASMSIPTTMSVPDSLRWLRRATTILLILANLSLILWANAPR